MNNDPVDRQGPPTARFGEHPSRFYSSVNFEALDWLGQDGPHGAIPHILHQVYINPVGGWEVFDTEVMKPSSHFRRDWWRSCQVGGLAGWALWAVCRFHGTVALLTISARAIQFL